MPLAVVAKNRNNSGHFGNASRKNDSSSYVSVPQIKGVARANLAGGSRENVEKALAEKDFSSLCFVNPGMYILNEEDFTFDDGWGHIFANSSEQICQVCAPPILIALYLGRYDLVKGLVESGEQLTFSSGGIGHRPILGHIITESSEAKLFTIGHYIMGDPNMPDELRLYLWTMIARELHKQNGEYRKGPGYSKIYEEIPLPVEFYYITFEEIDDTGLILFKKQEYIDTFLHSLEYVGKRRKRYFKNVPNENWRDIIGNRNKRISVAAVKILLEHGLYGVGNMKRWLISEYLTYRIEDFGALDSWELDMYEEIHKYYEGEDLEHIYYGLLINRFAWLQEDKKKGGYIFFGKKGRKEREKKEELLEHRLWSMIKDIYPVDQPLFHLFTLLTADIHRRGTTFLSKIRDVVILMEIYKKLTGKPIIIDADCGNLMIQDKDYTSDENGCRLEKLMWLEKVDSFSYNQKEPLGILQKALIEQNSLDILALAMRKGLLKGRHSDKAIEYCLENEGLLNKIPCIVAYADK